MPRPALYLCRRHAEPTISAAPTTNARNVEFVLLDSLGDGWNGATATIVDEMGDQILSTTLDDGSEKTEVLTLYDEICYTVDVSSANHDLAIRINGQLVSDWTMQDWSAGETSINATLAIVQPFTAGGAANTGILNPDEIYGKVALIGMSGTTWKGETDPDIKAKAIAARDAGAVAVIIANDDRDDPDDVYIMCPNLRLAHMSECPGGTYNLGRCNTGIAVGENCEGDGECETSNNANTCGSWDHYVVTEPEQLIDIPVFIVSYNEGVQAQSHGAGSRVVVRAGVDHEIMWTLSPTSDSVVISGGAPFTAQVQIVGGVIQDYCTNPSPHPTAPTPEPTLSNAPTSGAMIEMWMGGRTTPAGWNGAVATFSETMSQQVVQTATLSGAKNGKTIIHLSESICYTLDVTGGTYPTANRWGLACHPTCQLTCDLGSCTPSTHVFYIYQGEIIEGCTAPSPVPTTASPSISPVPTPLPTGAPTALPTISIAPTAFEAFELVSGECSTTALCIYSPNYPSAYGNNQDCVFSVKHDGILAVTSFDLENHAICAYDDFTVAGTEYCHTSGPEGVEITRGMTMTFHSDGGSTGPRRAAHARPSFSLSHAMAPVSSLISPCSKQSYGLRDLLRSNAHARADHFERADHFTLSDVVPDELTYAVADRHAGSHSFRTSSSRGEWLLRRGSERHLLSCRTDLGRALVLQSGAARALPSAAICYTPSSSAHSSRARRVG